MDAPPTVAIDKPAAIVDALREWGICLLGGIPAAAASDALRDDLLRLRDAGALHTAAVGRGSSRVHETAVRGDRTLWLDDPRCGTPAQEFLRALDGLRTELNCAGYLGLRSLEAHYAVYPAQARYARHRDRFRDSDARRVSLVTYLNKDWTPEHGGQLRLYRDGGPIDISPQAGTTVCFLSELEHEVLPAKRERMSIAAWLRSDDAINDA